ncbi:NAD(P)/FAD-dependent oxidoreductase [Streptomonospora nanhaiensis]|uniref:NAD(P)/FAD-dependent oxidoreductase n=1 Tax=Streptomonospora nanhaiensis TaxID=1323731 RepID=UPI001C38A624|nr:NAD(P)/FAD-dependent oxidoreductase [Streptomonospora nanhaiensis]MBV2362047.1 NAD(P)/FAD-dependent oxidoreductase [Streptomonospora nanhaiensis]MBX9391320.1 NAD(P)/FAD-dependent oxidoreductase [Streptomonospora nanhaiensis]
MTEHRNYRLVHGGGDESEIPHILIVGGGYLGMYTAKRLEKKLGAGEARITVVDPNSYMTYQPFLPEIAAGSISPRNVVVPLRHVFDRVRVLTGRVVRIDHANRSVDFEPTVGEPRAISYDYIVMAAGAVSRTLPIPGLAEWGIGIKTVEEAVFLRNHVLDQLNIADSTDDPEIRRKALNFVFVGGGFAGAEAIAELEDLARDATRIYPSIGVEDLRFYLIEAADRILPEVGPDVGERVLNQLKRRGIDVRLSTFLESAVDQRIKLSDGTEFDAGTLVWTAGVKPSPVVQAGDLPLGPKGHVDTSEYLTVNGVENAFAGGDNAQVPDGNGGFYPPNAQNAVRQAPVLADNVIAALRGKPMTPYRHKNLGAVAGLGLHKGAAQMFGRVKLTGRLAWYAHRAYHLYAVPTFNRKVRVLADWTIGFFLRRDFAALPDMDAPRQAFESASGPQVENGRLLRRVS